jgi:sterol desaturase/sphingolipid hydroxylase (fatty acid hydroxylase superfamily)
VQVENLPDPVDLAVPGFIALVLAEMLVARARDRRRYCPKDTLTSLMLGFGSSIASIIVGGTIFALATQVHQFRLFDIPYVWWAWPLCFVLDDLAYYVFHRSAHRVRWFWASHVIHHSSQHYNLSTALRQTWTGFLSAAFIFRLPLFLIGFPPAMVFFCAGLNLIYQFWIHTEAIGRCPSWFEAVMNTPSHHRVHHATNPRYLDRNYAGVFIIWDKMFGTYTPELDADHLAPSEAADVHGAGTSLIETDPFDQRPCLDRKSAGLGLWLDIGARGRPALATMLGDLIHADAFEAGAIEVVIARQLQ